jgi:hypothetical protein
MREEVAWYKEENVEEKFVDMLAGKTEGQRRNGRHRRGLDHHIKIDLPRSLVMTGRVHTTTCFSYISPLAKMSPTCAHDCARNRSEPRDGMKS